MNDGFLPIKAKSFAIFIKKMLYIILIISYNKKK